jgi:hypothetical protein
MENVIVSILWEAASVPAPATRGVVTEIYPRLAARGAVEGRFFQAAEIETMAV